jgi:hypothetical protein
MSPTGLNRIGEAYETSCGNTGIVATSRALDMVGSTVWRSRAELSALQGTIFTNPGPWIETMIACVLSCRIFLALLIVTTLSFGIATAADTFVALPIMHEYALEPSLHLQQIKPDANLIDYAPKCLDLTYCFIKPQNDYHSRMCKRKFSDPRFQ